MPSHRPHSDDQQPAAPNRLFFAIRPTRRAATRIARLAEHLRDRLDLRGRPLGEDRFHVTLYWLGDFVGSQREIMAVGAGAAEAATAIAMPPFKVAFDSVMSFSRATHGRPLVLCGGDGVAGVVLLRQTLAEAMNRAGIPTPAKSRFTPHLTLLYDDRSVAEQTIEPVGWDVWELVLVRSLLGRSRHFVIYRMPLGTNVHERAGCYRRTLGTPTECGPGRA